MSDPLFDAPVREPLFEDDPFAGQTVNYEATDFTITRMAGARQKALEMIERIKLQKADYLKWYDNRIASIEERVEQIEATISDIMHTMDVKSCATPLGTFTIRPTTETVWPKDSDVLTWIENNVPDPNRAGLLRFASKPDRDAIKKYLAEHNLTLPGLTVKPKETLVMKKPS